MRLKNLAGLVIGQHLVFDGGGYQLHLTAAETKTGRPYDAAVPRELNARIDRWLQVHRPFMQSIARAPGRGSAGDHLWLGRSGETLTSKGIRRRSRCARRRPSASMSGRTCSATAR
jgi:hypothetical protein